MLDLRSWAAILDFGMAAETDIYQYLPITPELFDIMRKMFATIPALYLITIKNKP